MITLHANAQIEQIAPILSSFHNRILPSGAIIRYIDHTFYIEDNTPLQSQNTNQKLENSSLNSARQI